MIYLGGVTLGYFNLYPVGFQPKNEPLRKDAILPAPSAQSGRRRKADASRPPARWPLHVFLRTMKNHR